MWTNMDRSDGWLEFYGREARAWWAHNPLFVKAMQCLGVVCFIVLCYAAIVCGAAGGGT
jgi:hypothetical protein